MLSQQSRGSGGARAKYTQVADEHDVIGVLSLYVGQHRLQSGGIAMDIGKDGKLSYVPALMRVPAAVGGRAAVLITFGQLGREALSLRGGGIIGKDGDHVV
jgi:hypothetical protein